MPFKDQLKRGKKYVRKTITLDFLNFVIISHLQGIKGKSIAGVINTIINEWIEHNSEKIKKDWNLDLNKYRKLAQMEYEELYSDNDMEEGKKKIIKKISESFQNIERIKIDEFAEGLKISQNILKEIIISYSNDLIKEGMNYFFKDPYLNKKKSE